MVDLGDVMVLLLFGALLVCLGFWLCYVFFRHLPSQQQRGVSMADLLRDAMHVTPMDPVDEEPGEATEVDESALPVDPSNPPFPRVYHRRPDRPVRRCHCHGRELEDGETVLFWPNPDIEGAFWLVCHPEEVLQP